MDERASTLQDSVTSVIIDTNVDRFLETGTAATRMQVDWFDPGNVISPAWGARIDQATWEVTP